MALFTAAVCAVAVFAAMGGFFKNYRQRRVSVTGPESIATLSAIERFFEGGKYWTQGAYHRLDGTKCLVGAAQSVRTAAIADARYWVGRAIAERYPYWVPFGQIEAFNDTHSFAEVAEVIERAKQLAAARQSPAPAAEIPPPSRAALTYQPEERVEIITMADLERVAVPRRD
jgi:hypothetical protein